MANSQRAIAIGESMGQSSMLLNRAKSCLTRNESLSVEHVTPLS